jgi:hypothetical protein
VETGLFSEGMGVVHPPGIKDGYSRLYRNKRWIFNPKIMQE